MQRELFQWGRVLLRPQFTDYVGSKYIYIVDLANNNHRFVGMNLESTLVDLKLDVAGYRNMFIGNRYEGTNGGTDIRFRDSSRFNAILYGHVSESTIQDDGEYNDLYRGSTVGLGTMTPSTRLHVVDPASAEIRIEGRATSSPSRRAILSLVSPEEASSFDRALGTLLQSGNDLPWFVGLPYGGGRLIVGRDATQPEYSANAYLTILDDGRVGLGLAAPSHPLEVGSDATNGNGAHVTAGGVWTNGSDRNSKTAFRPVNKTEVLESVLKLPVTRWRYKSESDTTHHIGPTAQDFHAAFHLGDSDKHISTIDADGVALAAIQGLYEIVKEKDTEITVQREQIAKQHNRMVQQARQIADLSGRVKRIESVLGEQANSDNGGAR